VVCSTLVSLGKSFTPASRVLMEESRSWREDWREETERASGSDISAGLGRSFCRLVDDQSGWCRGALIISRSIVSNFLLRAGCCVVLQLVSR
jgi:hypothetical protein